MAITKQSTSLFNALRVLGDEITGEKQAAAKTNGVKKKADESAPGVDPGGHDGKSTHPSADADNDTQPVSEGARSAENEKDVKANIGPPSVNNSSTVPKQDAVQLNIGTHQSATGEDSKVEDDYRDRLPDPGGYQGPTTHPATTGGEKYGTFKFAELHALQTNIANDLLADIANGFTAPKTAAAATQTFDQLSVEIEKLAGEVQKNVANNPEAAAAIAAGYHMAAGMGIEKTAAQREVAAIIEEAIKDAHFDADLFGHAVIASTELLRKQAAGEVNEGEDHNKPSDSSSGTGSTETAGGAGGAPGGGMDAGMGGGAGEGGGGEDYASLGALLGGDGAGGGGGAGAGAGGGQPSHEEILTELVSALQELGIPIDQLAAAGGGGGAGGGMPPPSGGGGMPPPDAGGGMLPPGGGGAMMPPPDAGGGMMPPGGGAGMPPGGAGMPPGGAGGMPPMPPDEGMKLARACRHFQLSGKYRLKTANDNTRERQLRDRLKDYVLEVIRR